MVGQSKEDISDSKGLRDILPWQLIFGKNRQKYHKNGHNFSCMRHIQAEIGFEIGFVLSGSSPYFHTRCGLSANLRRRSETCWTRLAENTGRKKVAKNRHLGTFAPLCRAISSQLKHVSTIGKKLVKQQYMSSTCPHNMVNFGLLAAEID